ncbi:Sec-independent protein translocase protein TatB [Thiopseudomonas denitrificans]|uniref:Sec-independent protein translocase protein TatB n=1 Tax=Thiopseudomonas denitrificans TaxID=1501432 RepID=A0A4R6TQT5_9GAMM|nr:Sec-independent protein translocase protein TatB [Thiopseudomonas denitrificans]TDQ35319.1 sec-independent protein translocase protein TatB [Thiopseudomonas denitrificans]
MFDIGFSELLMVGLVALIVIGPERLPTAARTIGLLLGRVKRGINSVREEVEREIGADQIKLQLRNEEILAKERKLLEDTLKQATSVGADFEQKLRETTSILNSPAVSDTEQKNGVDSKPEPASIEQDKQQQ